MHLWFATYDHYGTAVVPTRVEHPTDKGHAEGSVSYATTCILAALRSSTFLSLNNARKAVAEKLEKLNEASFIKLEGNRRLAYEILLKFVRRIILV